MSDLHRFAVPVLAEYDVPGHLEVVVGQMGQVRRIGASSYNGFRHMGAEELRDMLGRGWGVGNHSWTHESVNAGSAEIELARAKQVLEEAIGAPVTIYCSPGSNDNMNEEALDACRRFGYLGAMSLTDALNRPDAPDLLWMNRTFLHTQGYPPFFSEFDPFRNIQHAKHDRGWVIDYLHCPLERPVHPSKDCSAAQLRQRIETVCAEGGDGVWLAKVEDAVDYRYTRRHARIERRDEHTWEIRAADLPRAVRDCTITVRLGDDAAGVELDGRPCPPRTIHGKKLLDVDLSRPHTLSVPPRH